jgi:proteasome lid subunit RPN8/RPN11
MKNTKSNQINVANRTLQNGCEVYSNGYEKNSPSKVHTSKKHSNSSTLSQKQPQMRMSKAVHTEIVFSICSRPPETGGLLLGPIGSNDITDFFFDKGADSTGATYSPDHITLNKKMKEEWMPSGNDMKGFVHSHPGKFDCLSHGDLEYISRLLAKNEDMDIFFAPIVIPSEYRIRPLAVLRDNPKVSLEAKLVLF